MIAALICVISIAAFLQFFVSYCRSVISASRGVELSERVREITGIAGGIIPADDFERLLQLVRLCPERSDDGTKIRAVDAYHNLLRAVNFAARAVMPGVVAWVERELQGCSYFAAVALDRRISSSRDLFSQQAADRF
jgi:hypothetical protein